MENTVDASQRSFIFGNLNSLIINYLESCFFNNSTFYNCIKKTIQKHFIMVKSLSEIGG